MTPPLASRLSTWQAPPDTVGIVALGQAGFALVSEAVLLLIDPFLSFRPDRLVPAVVDPTDLTGVTAVLATHEHEDHLDLAAWAGIAKASPGATFVVPEALVPLATAAGIPADRVAAARIGAEMQLGATRVTAVPARHAVRMEDGYSTSGPAGGPPRYAGYVVEVAGVRVYHAGDTLADERIVESVAPMAPDIALLPINGRDPQREASGIVGNMTPDEAASLAHDVGVKLAVPMHFDAIRGNTGHPDAFVAAMRRRHPAASVWVPVAGTGFAWPGPAGARG